MAEKSPQSYMKSGVDDEEESPKLEEVLWGYFEREGDGKARCVVCQATVGEHRDELNRHMEENHPKLIGHVPPDTDEASVASNDADEDNTFTEVVYLEQDALQDVDTQRTQQKKRRRSREKSKPIIKVEQKTSKKRYRDSTSSDDYPIRRKERRVETEDELTIFLKYIKCLLQKLSREAFGKVQMKIVNEIMNAQNESYLELSHDKLNLVTVNEVSGPTSGHNYSITVAPCTSKREVNDERKA